MREKYWALYEELIDTEFYYWHYRSRSAFWEKATNIITCISSAAGIATWIIWKQHEWVWAIVVGASQIINAIRHLFPFPKQISAVSLFLPELKRLINEVDRDWNKINSGTMTDDDANLQIYKYKERLLDLESKYISDTSFPRKRLCQYKALKDRENYFFQNYGITAEIRRKERIYAFWRKKKSTECSTK